MCRKDSVIRRMIDAVGDAEQDGAGDEPRIAQVQAEYDQGKSAKHKTDEQDFPGAEVIGEISDRCLGQTGNNCKDRECKAKVDIADAEPLLQEWKQHRQHEHMEMADPMSRRNRSECAQHTIRVLSLRSV